MKKIISMCLAVALVIGCLAMTAPTASAEAVQVVDITVPVPQLGDTITYDGVQITGGTLWDDQTVWVGEGWEPVSGTFADEQWYCLDLYVLPATGAYYDPDTTVVTVNGAPYEGNVFVYEDYVNVEFVASFRTETVNYVELSGLPESVEAGPAPAVVPQVECGEVRVRQVRWVTRDGQPVDTLELGKDYFYEVILEPNSGYQFGGGLDVFDGIQYRETVVEDETTALLRIYFSLKTVIETVELTLTGFAPGDDVSQVQVSVPQDANYSIAMFDWYTMQYPEREWFREGVFADGRGYEAEFQLVADADSRFSGDVTLLVNGSPFDNWGTDEAQEYLMGTIAVSYLTAVAEVELTVPEPQVGSNVADAIVTVPENVYYSVESYSWWDCTGEYQEVTSGQFQEGHRYELSFTLLADPGYCILLDHEPTLNGEPMENFRTYFLEQAMDGERRWSFFKPVEKVELPAFPEVQTGSKVENGQLTVPAGSHYTAEGTWFDVPLGDIVTELVYGGIYQYEIFIQPEAGYEITADTAFTVGGVAYDGQMMTLPDIGGYIIVKLYCMEGVEQIDKVELTVPAPEVGQLPGVVTSEVYAQYELGNYDWSAGSVDSWHDIPYMDPGETCQEGNYHIVDFSLMADSGCAFADDVQVYINGRLVNAKAQIENYGAGLHVCYSFGKLAATERGDVDGQPGVTEDDAIYLLLNVLFGDEMYPVAGDANFDGSGDVTEDDAIYLLLYVLFGDEMYPLN